MFFCRVRFSSILMVLAISIFGQPAVALDDQRPLRIDVGGFRLNSVLLQAGRHADLPPIVFIHGASASLYDPMLSFRQMLEGRAKLLFVDRPGHGQSDVGGKENIFPDGQADAIATLMNKRKIGRAIVVSHSFGGAIAASLATRHPDLVAGLVFSRRQSIRGRVALPGITTRPSSRSPVRCSAPWSFRRSGCLRLTEPQVQSSLRTSDHRTISHNRERCRRCGQAPSDTMPKRLPPLATGPGPAVSPTARSRRPRSSSPATRMASYLRMSTPGIWHVTSGVHD